MKSPKRRQIGADALLLLVTLIWGSTFVMVKEAVASYPVFPFLSLRFGLATIALLLVGWKRLATLGWKGLGAGILIGLFLLAGYGFQTIGLQYTSASQAGFITGLSVVLVPILSTLLLRRLPPYQAIIGVCLATIGLALLSLNQGLRIATGDLLILCCALSFALHIVAVSAFAPGADPIALTIVQVATVSLASALISLFTGGPIPLPTPPTWFAAAFTGILATAVAFGLQTAMQRFTTPTHTALIFTGEPVFAAIFGVLLAGDIMTGRGIAGGILIIVGNLVSEMNWSERTATVVSRFLSPHYVAVPVFLLLGLNEPTSWRWGLGWASGLTIVAVAMPLLLFSRELRRGKISDWHISDRRERLNPILIAASFLASVVPLVLIILFHGPRLLFAAFLSASLLVVVNLAITFRWKISQHVSSVALGTTLAAATLGFGAAPLLLLIPLVAWARVKVGAHTVMQAIAGGLAGTAITFLALRFCGLS